MGNPKADELLIITKLGKLRGKSNKSDFSKKEYFSFLGIPYAEPPVGKLRFKVSIGYDMHFLKDVAESDIVNIESQRTEYSNSISIVNSI